MIAAGPSHGVCPWSLTAKTPDSHCILHLLRPTVQTPLRASSRASQGCPHHTGPAVLYIGPLFSPENILEPSSPDCQGRERQAWTRRLSTNTAAVDRDLHRGLPGAGRGRCGRGTSGGVARLTIWSRCGALGLDPQDPGQVGYLVAHRRDCRPGQRPCGRRRAEAGTWHSMVSPPGPAPCQGQHQPGTGQAA